MIKLAEKTKIAGLFAMAAILVAGCAKESPNVEDVDLTQSTNLFEEPLQPNPLALTPEDVVVVVNGEEITHGEVMQGVQMNMMQLSRQVPQQELAKMAGKMYQNVTDTLIANLLLTDAAKKSGLTINDADLDAEIAKIKENAPEGSSLEDALAENNISMDEWKENLREQMLVRKLVEEKTAGIEDATPAEVSEFYEKNIDEFKTPETVSASHILISVKPEDTEETKAAKKKQLEEIRAEIVAGADFAKVAKEKSDCPSAQRGGDLGSFGRGQMVPEFEDAAFSMDVGDLSDIVETQFGYHLIKVTDHKQPGVRSLADVKDRLTNYLTNQKKQKALMDYVEELKTKADIEYKKQDLDAAEKTNETENAAE